MKFLPPGITVDEETVRLDRPSEVQFRYSSACVEGSCLHWRDGGCTALDEVRDHFSSFALSAPGSCSIRHQCRWHLQGGDAACTLCPLVSGELMALEDGIEPPGEEAFLSTAAARR